MKKLFATAALVVAAMSVSAEVTPRVPLVPWGAQAEIIITSDLTQKNSDGSWSLNADAQQWITTTYQSGEDIYNDTTLVQQTNRNNVWYDFYDEATDTMIVTSAEKNWGGYLSVLNKAGVKDGLIVVGANRYPAFYVTGTDKAKFYFSGSASKAGYPQIEVYEVGAEEPVAKYTGDIALTKSTWDKSTLLIAEGLDKTKSYKIVARTMALNAETNEYTYEGGDIVLQVVKLYGDQAPMREDGLIISGSEIGSYINQHLTAYPDVKDFTLEGSGKYTIAESIAFNNGFSISGIASAPATIDASALGAPFIKMSDTPGVEAVESGQFVITTPTKIENIKVVGLTKNFFADGGKGYTFVNFTVNNILLQYNTQSGVVWNFAAAMAINFNISNSTFYSNEPGTANFIALSGKRPWQTTGYEEETGKLTFANNTLYNVAKSKQFLNTNTLKGQRYLYEVNSNIFVDVSNKKIYGNMTNNANQLTTDGKNTYLFDGEFFSEPNYNGDEGLQTDPSFKNAAAGDFTIAANTLQAKFRTGDPRWVVAYATDAIDIEVDQSENTDFAAVLNEKLQASEQPSSIKITFFEAGEYPLTQAITTTAPITIQNAGDIDAGVSTIVVNNPMTLGGAIKIDGVNIDATNATAPVITLASNEYKKLDNGFFDLGSIQFKNMTVKGLAQPLIKDNGTKNKISEVLVENCVIELGEIGNKVPFDFSGGSGSAVGAFNIKKSTIWAATPTSGSLFSTQSGSKPTEAGFTVQNFAIDNSTLYNVAKSKNFYTHRQNSQTWLAYYLRNSLIVNCGKSGQFVKGMNGGGNSKNPKWTVSGNAFFFGDEELVDQSANESTGDDEEPVQNSIAGSIEFADLATGNFSANFTLAEGIEIPNSLGDPRWTIKFVQSIVEPSGEVLYALVEGDTFTSGQIVEVKSGDDVVATIQYGEEGGNAFNAAVADGNASAWGYTAYTSGNGTNGNKTGGTWYTIVPAYSGVISAAIVLNADKKFHLTIDGEQNPTFDNNTVSEKFYGPISFNVIGGKAYKFYCDGSKLGFYGFDYKYGPDVEPIVETDVASQVVTVGIQGIPTATVTDGAVYNMNGQRVQTLSKGMYIQNGKKFIVK